MVQVNFKILKKNGFIHFYIFETYKWGFSQSKFTYKDSFMVVPYDFMTDSIRKQGLIGEDLKIGTVRK